MLESNMSFPACRLEFLLHVKWKQVTAGIPQSEPAAMNCFESCESLGKFAIPKRGRSKRRRTQKHANERKERKRKRAQKSASAEKLQTIRFEATRLWNSQQKVGRDFERNFMGVFVLLLLRRMIHKVSRCVPPCFKTCAVRPVFSRVAAELLSADPRVCSIWP